MNGKEAAFSFCSSVFFDLILAIFSPQVMFWFILRGHACERGGGAPLPTLTLKRMAQISVSLDDDKYHKRQMQTLDVHHNNSNM